MQESGEQQFAWVEPHMIWSRLPAFEVVAATAVEAV